MSYPQYGQTMGPPQPNMQPDQYEQQGPPEFDPELIQYILSNYGHMLNMDQAGEDANVADALRQAQSPDMVNGGRATVAASPLSHLARVGKQYIGERDYRDARRREDEASVGMQNAIGAMGAEAAGMDFEKQELPEYKQSFIDKLLKLPGR